MSSTLKLNVELTADDLLHVVPNAMLRHRFAVRFAFFDDLEQIASFGEIGDYAEFLVFQVEESVPVG